MKQLHTGAKWLFRLKAYLVLLLFAFISGGFIISALAGIIFRNITILITLICTYAVITLIFAEIYARMTHARWFYEFASEQLRLERGIIWKRYSNIPYERIQNIDIHRGVIARILGFSSINIQTAGYSAPARRGFGAYAEGYIPAISSDEAEKIREFVIKKISAHKKSQGL